LAIKTSKRCDNCTLGNLISNISLQLLIISILDVLHNFINTRLTVKSRDLVWSPPPHIPYISSPNQCLLYIQQTANQRILPVLNNACRLVPNGHQTSEGLGSRLLKKTTTCQRCSDGRFNWRMKSTGRLTISWLQNIRTWLFEMFYQCVDINARYKLRLLSVCLTGLIFQSYSRFGQVPEWRGRSEVSTHQMPTLSPNRQ